MDLEVSITFAPVRSKTLIVCEAVAKHVELDT